MEFVAQISQIVGIDVSDPKAEVRFSYNTYEEARELVKQLKNTIKRLQLLKQEVNATISAIKSEYATERTSVGKTLGGTFATAFMGRKAAGGFNSLRRDELRRSQVDAVSQYEKLKAEIDGIVAKLSGAKGKIELSPTYQTKPNSPTAKSSSIPPPLPISAAPKYFVYLNEEVKGPYSREQLVALCDTGMVSAETQCCISGGQEWIPYGEL